MNADAPGISPKRLALLIHALHGGGAERALAAMANHWSEDGKQVTVITLSSRDTDVFTLRDTVERIDLGLMSESRFPGQGIWKNWVRVRALRSAISESRADVILSFTEKMNILTLLAAGSTDAPVLICERTDPRHHPLARSWKVLRSWTYPRCCALVVQTESVRGYAQQLVRGRPVHIIPNFVAQPSHSHQARESRRIITVGRLSHEKGIDLLLAAFARLYRDHPAWSLVVIGEGPAKAELMQTSMELGIQDRVEFPGWSRQPEREMSESSVFVLPSRYEGFPNALLEAMASGLAVISFDCRSGPAEIITHESDGLLVPPGDSLQLARSLERIILDEPLRQRLGQQARSVVNRFGRDTIFARWDELLCNVTTNSTPQESR